MKGGQSSVEFVILIGAALFIFSALLFAVYWNIQDGENEKFEKELEEIARVVQDEITLAYSTTDGYFRSFYIPEKVSGRDYQINIVEESVYIRSGERYSAAFTTFNLTGDTLKGQNNISKTNGTIYLNVNP